MTPVELSLLLVAVGAVAGLAGSLIGLGGGFVVVPVLTLVLGVNVHLAIGASVICVIATSSAAAVAFARDRLANLRVGMFLEMATTIGGATGAWLAAIAQPKVLFAVFGIVLVHSAVSVWRNREDRPRPEPPPDPVADRLHLHGVYAGDSGVLVAYRVARSRLALGLMYGAGVLSGLLGVGSGSLKVPAMDGAMGMPIKASTATSNFMIGVTAAASAGVYFARGDVVPILTAPLAVGILAGAFTGSRLLPSVRNAQVRKLFAIIVLAIAVDMIFKGVVL
jgi:uncharacterized membrane protein YfcA